MGSGGLYRSHNVMGHDQTNNITSILTRASSNGATALRGRILTELWVRSHGADSESDEVDLLLHLPDGSVQTARVQGPDAQVVAGSFGVGDDVVARVRERAGGDVVVVEGVHAAPNESGRDLLA